MNTINSEENGVENGLLKRFQSSREALFAPEDSGDKHHLLPPLIFLRIRFIRIFLEVEFRCSI